MAASCCSVASQNGTRFCGHCGEAVQGGHRGRLFVLVDLLLFGLGLVICASLPSALHLFLESGITGVAALEDDGAADRGTSLRSGDGASDETPSVELNDSSSEGAVNRRVSELMARWRPPSPGPSSSSEEGAPGVQASHASRAKLVGVPVTYQGQFIENGLPISKVSASDFTRTRRPGIYSPLNVFDGDSSTAWQVSHAGVGHWIRFDFSQDVTLSRLGLVSGYDKVLPDRWGDRWPLNNRVQSILVSWDGGSQTFRLEDVRSLQSLDMGGVVTSFLEIEIRGIFTGSQWNDTLISEIELYGEPRAVP